MNHNLIRFAEVYQLEVRKRLGFGIHGSVYVVKSPKEFSETAVKIHTEYDSFNREFEVYRRLAELDVKEVCGFAVPQMLVADEEFLAIQMTIVSRPFILDFAGAYVDFKPHFSEEIWAEWRAQKIDQYGPRWPEVCKVLDALEELDIYMIDVSPSNIAFRD
jgi:hypothetical protein